MRSPETTTPLKVKAIHAMESDTISIETEAINLSKFMFMPPV
jgi:hypothetical protein